MNLENITLNVGSQIQIGHIVYDFYLYEIPGIDRFIGAEWNSGWHMLGGGKWGILFNGYRDSICDGEDGLEIVTLVTQHYECI